MTVFLKILELAGNEFPTDWMNWKNVVKYDIGSDPLILQRIDSSRSGADMQRKLNLKPVPLLRKAKVEFHNVPEVLGRKTCQGTPMKGQL